jgi:hypothetical protein
MIEPVIPTPHLPLLTVADVHKEARIFANAERVHPDRALFGITDGKAVGTYLEGKFQEYLGLKYDMKVGNAALGLDLPSINTDIKTTSIRQPQSSSPFSSARQKIYGLGYSLLVFAYEKRDDASTGTAILDIQHVVFIDSPQTGDYQMTSAILDALSRNANADDLVAIMQDRNLPVDDIEVRNIANNLLVKPPIQGVLTISNALQWRLQYRRAIEMAGKMPGVHAL